MGALSACSVPARQGLTDCDGNSFNETELVTYLADDVCRSGTQGYPLNFNCVAWQYLNKHCRPLYHGIMMCEAFPYFSHPRSTR